MKQFIPFLALFFAIGCTNQEQSKDHSTHENMQEMHLNNGQKWKMDSSTRTHIAAMENMMGQSLNNPPVNNQGLADSLQSEADQLIRDCRMQGKDHDMLHMWLENYLSDIKKARSAPPAEQEKAVQQLDKDLKEVHTYFE